MTLLSEAELIAIGFRPSETIDIIRLINLKETAGELKTKDDAKRFLREEDIMWW